MPSEKSNKSKKPSLPNVSGGYWSGAHTRHRLRYHLVWVPKYRRRVLTGKIAQRLEALLSQACEVNRWEMLELSIMEDHVHLLLQISPKESLSNVVRRLKGGSSRVIREEFPDLDEFLWGDHFWSSGFFAETVGQLAEQVVRRYIRDQFKEDQFKEDETELIDFD